MSPQELRRFGLRVAVPLALLAGLGSWGGHTLLSPLLGELALVLGGLALLAPRLLRPVHKGWMRGAEALGWFNTRLLLGLAYYLVMTPTGLLLRWRGRDPLDRRLHDRSSYWIARPPQVDPKDTMERRF